MERYSGAPAVFDSLTLTDAVTFDCSPGAELLIARASGMLGAGGISAAKLQAMFSVSSQLLGTIMTAVNPITGLYCSTLSMLQYQARAAGGGFASGSSHVRVRATQGLLVPESVEATQDATTPAQMALKFHAQYDGTNAILAVLGSQALSGTPGVGQVYKLGPVTIGSTVIDGVQRSRVNFGIDVKPEYGDGEEVPRANTIEAVNPSFEIDAKNFSSLVSRGLGVVAITDAVKVYFRKVGSAASATDHLCFTISAGTIHTASVAATGNQVSVPRFVVTGSGSTPIAVSTGVALP
jgi:hypothetical protein